MENLLCQRFNFFLVLFALFLAGGFGADVDQKSLIFGIGFVVELLMWSMVYRAHVKHDWIMRCLYDQKDHPVAQVNDAIKAKGLIGLRSVSKVTGIYMPLACILILGTLALFYLQYSILALQLFCLKSKHITYVWDSQRLCCQCNDGQVGAKSLLTYLIFR